MYILEYNNLMHIDIKPENILINKNMKVKLAGTLSLRYIPESYYIDELGDSFCFWAPECFIKSKFSPKSMMWSLGCCLYYICSYRLPFVARKFKELSYSVRKVVPLNMPMLCAN